MVHVIVTSPQRKIIRMKSRFTYSSRTHTLFYHIIKMQQQRTNIDIKQGAHVYYTQDKTTAPRYATRGYRTMWKYALWLRIWHMTGVYTEVSRTCSTVRSERYHREHIGHPPKYPVTGRLRQFMGRGRREEEKRG